MRLYLILPLALSACGITDEYRDSDGAFVIRHHDGGMIEAVERQLVRLGPTPVRIEGWCASSCTMYLGAENVCMAEDARFAFHGPTEPLSGFLAPYMREDRDEWLERLTAPYPEQLRRWFFATGKDKLFGPLFYTLPAADIHRMTGIPYCKEA